MTIAIYCMIGLAATLLGKIETRVNVAAASIPIALPLAFFSAIGAAFWVLLIAKTGVLLIALLALLIAKLKFIIGVKVAAIFASMAAATLGIFAGPLGWILIAIMVYVFFIVLKQAAIHTFVHTYEWIFLQFARILVWIREKSDAARAKLPDSLQFLVFFFEAPLVCSSSASSIWGLMEWFDGKIELTAGLIIARLVCMTPFLVLAFLAYRKDTAPS